MSGNSPKAGNPKRLSLKKIDKVKLKNSDIVELRITLDYTTWCCNDSHELSDAVVALQNLLELAETYEEKD